MIFNILDNTTELWMTKYIIGEIFSSGGETFYKNPSDQTVMKGLFTIFGDSPRHWNSGLWIWPLVIHETPPVLTCFDCGGCPAISSIFVNFPSFINAARKKEKNSIVVSNLWISFLKMKHFTLSKKNNRIKNFTKYNEIPGSTSLIKKYFAKVYIFFFEYTKKVAFFST